MEKIDTARDFFGLLILISLAFLIRFLILIRSSFICPDCTQYVTIAKNLITKGQYISDGSHFPDIIQPPLYPLITSIFIPFLDNPELAGRIVSAVFGSLLIIPFFSLSQKIFDKKVAYIGSILIAIYPALIKSSIDPLSESTFIFFIYTAILSGWIALERWNWMYFFLTGMIFGLSYLARIEGLAYLLIFLLFSIVFSIFKKRGLKEILIPTLVLLGFLLCVFPYQVYVGKKMGTFFIIPKLRLILTHRLVSRNLIMNHSFGEDMNKTQKVERVYFGLTEDSSELLANRLFFKDSNFKKEIKKMERPPSIYFNYRPILYNLWQTYKNVYQYSLILPPGLIIFLVIGFFNEFWAYPHWNKNLFIFMMFLAGHVFLLSHVSARFVFSSIPIIILWQSIGILKAEDWLKKTIASYYSSGLKDTGYRLSSTIILVLFLAISVVPASYMVFKRSSNEDDSLKKIGLWMKENINRSSTVIASRPQGAFYGGMKYLTLPYAEFKDIAKYAEVNCGDYLLLYTDEDIKLRPFLKPLMRDGFIDSTLRSIKKMDTKKGGSFYLYEFITKRNCKNK